MIVSISVSVIIICIITVLPEVRTDVREHVAVVDALRLFGGINSNSNNNKIVIVFGRFITLVYRYVYIAIYYLLEIIIIVVIIRRRRIVVVTIVRIVIVLIIC